MVSTVLHTVGLSQDRTFQTYHRVLNRAIWSSLKASHMLLHLLRDAFAPVGRIVLGIDETIERRRGAKIAAAGIYRDPVRSSHGHFVKVNGLRWVCLMLLVPIPWAGRVWALPFLSALAPSERYARGMVPPQTRDPLGSPANSSGPSLAPRPLVGGGWRPGLRGARPARALRPVATMITRLRLDAHLVAPPPASCSRARMGVPASSGSACRPWSRCEPIQRPSGRPSMLARWYGDHERRIEYVAGDALWYHTGFVPVPIRWVLIRDPLGKFATQALLCTDQEARSRPDPALVCPALADGSHLP